jgi:flotillin
VSSASSTKENEVMLSAHALVAPVLVLLALLLVWLGLSRSLVIAQPDEWLLSIRNGRLVQAGIGISLWRRPGDVVARFTSTMQRVGFSVQALSGERLRVAVEGFIFWSVSVEGDGPFRAFQKLGLVNLNAPPRDLKSPKHLLSTPQHRAFQQLLAAAVQRLAATWSLEELLLQQEGVVAALRRELSALEQELGIRIDQLQILQVRPDDEALLQKLSAKLEAQVREEAASIELAASERAQRRQIETEARIAAEQAEARGRELARDQGLCLAQLANERERKRHELEIACEQALAQEQQAMQVAQAAQQRAELELAGRLDRMRREAEAQRDAILALTSAEEKKSQQLLDHELARLVAEKVGDALKQLPIRDARWISVGPDSPAASLAGLIASARELTAATSRGAGRKA